MATANSLCIFLPHIPQLRLARYTTTSPLSPNTVTSILPHPPHHATMDALRRSPAPSPIIPPTLPQNSEKRKFSVGSDAVDSDEAPACKKVTRPLSRRPCIVCADDVAINRFPKIPHKQDENNRHGSDACFRCYSQHLSIEIKEKGHEAVSCPQCSKTLEESEVRKLVSSRTYHEYVSADSGSVVARMITDTPNLQVHRQSREEMHATGRRVSRLSKRQLLMG